MRGIGEDIQDSEIKEDEVLEFGDWQYSFVDLEFKDCQSFPSEVISGGCSIIAGHECVELLAVNVDVISEVVGLT